MERNRRPPARAGPHRDPGTGVMRHAMRDTSWRSRRRGSGRRPADDRLSSALFTTEAQRSLAFHHEATKGAKARSPAIHPKQLFLGEVGCFVVLCALRGFVVKQSSDASVSSVPCVKTHEGLQNIGQLATAGPGRAGARCIRSRTRGGMGWRHGPVAGARRDLPREYHDAEVIDAERAR